jgi:hypothetical protein
MPDEDPVPPEEEPAGLPGVVGVPGFVDAPGAIGALGAAGAAGALAAPPGAAAIDTPAAPANIAVTVNETTRFLERMALLDDGSDGR